MCMTPGLYPNPQDSIPVENLINGNIYELRSRNLAVGVWVESQMGFIGIREKFNELYLFMEYEYTTGGRLGTAVPVKNLGISVPYNIPLTEYLGTECGTHHVQMLFNKDLKKWVHVGETEPCETPKPFLLNNLELFDLLEVLDKPIRAERERIWAEEKEKYRQELADKESAELTANQDPDKGTTNL